MNLPGRSFGGFETFITGLAPRLVERGHEVTVYSRSQLYPQHPQSFSGVNLRWLPALEGKATGTPSHTLLAMLDAVPRRFDSMLVVNPGMGFHCVIPRLVTRTRVAMNVDGIEWERGKWGRLGRWYYKQAARVATKLCHVIVADSEAMQVIYRKLFGTESVFIPYAFDPVDCSSTANVERLGLTPKGYYLIVGRMIPENNVDFMCEEFASAATTRPLLVVGSANYQSTFHERLRRAAGDRVRFLGHVDDMDVLWELYAHAYAYLHGHSVGGTNPALLQALATATCPIVLDVSFNREVAGAAGLTFKRVTGSLRAIIEYADHCPEDVDRRGEAARDRLRTRYSWKSVVDGYEAALAAPRIGHDSSIHGTRAPVTQASGR